MNLYIKYGDFLPPFTVATILLVHLFEQLVSEYTPIKSCGNILFNLPNVNKWTWR